MENNNLDIPIEIKVDTKDQSNLKTVATGAVLDLLFGKDGLLRPKIKTSFWWGSHYINIDLH